MNDPSNPRRLRGRLPLRVRGRLPLRVRGRLPLRLRDRLPRPLPILLSATALIVASVAIAAQGSPTITRAASNEVGIVDFAFEPADLTVTAGTVVTWINKAGQNHTVTADDGSFDSGEMSPTDAYGNLFDVAGTFTYRCTIHPDQMRGTITVLEATPAPTLEPGVTPSPTPPTGLTPPPTASPEATATAAPATSGDGSTGPGSGKTPAPDGETTGANGPDGSDGTVLVVVATLLAGAGALLIAARRRRDRQSTR